MDKLIIIDLIIYLVPKYSQLLFSKEMLDLIKKNINLRSGIILLSLTIFFVFITNSFKKNKSKDISDFVVQVEKGILSDSINTSGEVKAIRTSNIGLGSKV